MRSYRLAREPLRLVCGLVRYADVIMEDLGAVVALVLGSLVLL